MAILGLVLAAVPAALFRVLPGAELKGATRDIAASLREARSQALLGNREISFLVDVEDGSYEVQGAGPLQILPEGVKVELEAARSEMIDEKKGVIRFFPDGSSTGGRVTLSGEARQYHVMVNWLTGQVSVVE